MEPLEKMVQVLAAGAVSSQRPNVIGLRQTEIIDRYYTLKELLEEKYQKVEYDILDIGPASAGRQQTLMAQLEATGAYQDEEVVRQIDALWAAIEEHDPEAMWAATPDEHDEATVSEVDAATEAAVVASANENDDEEVAVAKDEEVEEAVDDADDEEE